METDVHFSEVQRFRQPWLWALLGVQLLVVLARLVRGDRSRRETARELLPVLAAAVTLRVATLRTEVRSDGVYVRLAPFHRSFRRIAFSDLVDVRATSYSPIRYGGWGICWRPGSMAYTVSGTTGVRFERPGEKSVFVGSRRPDALLDAVREQADLTV